MSPTKNFTLSVTPALRRRGVGFGNSLRIDVDADSARTELSRGRDYDAAVPAAEVIDNVGFCHIRELEHRGDDGIFGRNPDHIRFALRRLR
jgi:hypothetical protein